MADSVHYEERISWESRPADVRHDDVSDVTIGPRGDVYLLTRSDPGILVYGAGGTFKRSVGAESLTELPHGIAVDGTGRIYCVLEDAHTVKVLDPDGSLSLTNFGRGGG